VRDVELDVSRGLILHIRKTKIWVKHLSAADSAPQNGIEQDLRIGAAWPRARSAHAGRAALRSARSFASAEHEQDVFRKRFDQTRVAAFGKTHHRLKVRLILAACTASHNTTRQPCKRQKEHTRSEKGCTFDIEREVLCLLDEPSIELQRDRLLELAPLAAVGPAPPKDEVNTLKRKRGSAYLACRETAGDGGIGPGGAAAEAGASATGAQNRVQTTRQQPDQAAANCNLSANAMVSVRNLSVNLLISILFTAS
jgi:hypothetical protein